jgi:predicted phosphodiesterase
VRIAVVSDIHGNRTAFEAVLADLRETSPDLILHGGDLADGGASPAEIVDQIRDLGWRGVLGNADEMYSRPESLEEFVSQSSAPPALWNAVRDMAAATAAVLGQERIQWLGGLPHTLKEHPIALVHASPQDCWRAPRVDADEIELESVYGPLRMPVAVYGHIHRPFVRTIPSRYRGEMIVANTGSVSHSYDGDRRASYLLIDELNPVIRRVDYDLEKELNAVSASGLPHRDWIARILVSASPQMP